MKYIRFIALLVFFQLSLNVCAQDIVATSANLGKQDCIEVKKDVVCQITDQHNTNRVFEDRNPAKKKTKSPEQKRRNTVKIYDVVGTIIMCILDGFADGQLYYNRH